mgnify:CR=1 FL=1
MPQYMVRKGKIGHEIAKFDDTDSPVDIYTITSRGCSCPARTRSCKHIRIVKAWEKAAKQLGLVFDDNAKVIGNIFNDKKNTQNMGLVERLSRV